MMAIGSANQSLDLRDIHLPAEPSAWPPAPGWWLLFLLAMLIVWWLTSVLRKKLQRRRRIQRVLVELDVIEQVLPLQQQPMALLAAYSGLARRACRAFAPSALALSGEDWLRFLDGDDATQPFSMGPGRLLLHGQYRATVEVTDVEPLSELLRRRLRVMAEQADA